MIVPMFEYSKGSGRALSGLPADRACGSDLCTVGICGIPQYQKRKRNWRLNRSFLLESLLETTKQAEQEDLEDIGYNEKSETRVLIEKFVDENPEAVAVIAYVTG